MENNLVPKIGRRTVLQGLASLPAASIISNIPLPTSSEISTQQLIDNFMEIVKEKQEAKMKLQAALNANIRNVPHNIPFNSVSFHKYEDNLNRKFDMARNNLVNRLQKTIAPDVPEPKWHVGGFTQPSQKMVSKLEIDIEDKVWDKFHKNYPEGYFGERAEKVLYPEAYEEKLKKKKTYKIPDLDSSSKPRPLPSPERTTRSVLPSPEKIQAILPKVSPSSLARLAGRAVTGIPGFIAAELFSPTQAGVSELEEMRGYAPEQYQKQILINAAQQAQRESAQRSLKRALKEQVANTPLGAHIGGQLHYGS